MRLAEQIEILDNIITEVCDTAEVSIDDIRSSFKSNILVAARVLIVKKAVKQKIVLRLIQDKINRDRCSLLHYLNGYKKTYDYEMLKYKLEK